MKDFSDHVDTQISELEVFIGDIINQTGKQTRREKDRSGRLREEISRITMWATEVMRPLGDGDEEDGPPPGFETDTSTLEFCFACLCQGTGTNPLGARRRQRQKYEFKSFRIVAACALLGEMGLFEKGQKKGQ